MKKNYYFVFYKNSSCIEQVFNAFLSFIDRNLGLYKDYLLKGEMI